MNWSKLKQLVERGFAALRDDDALLQSLAVVDKRIGKRRLVEIDPRKLHPLAQKLLTVRLSAEGLARETVAA